MTYGGVGGVWVCVCVCVCGGGGGGGRGGLHLFFSQNLQRRSLCLSELVKAFVEFHLSPRTCAQPCVTPLSHHPVLYRMEHTPLPLPVYATISFPCFCARCSNPSSGADPDITMSRAAICVLTGSAGGTLWMAAKTIHSHGVPHTPMLFYSFILGKKKSEKTASFITAGAVANIFLFFLRTGAGVYNSPVPPVYITRK